MTQFSYGQLEQLWINAAGSKAMAPLMAAIAMAESGGDSTQKNTTDNGGTQTSWGLWQISDGTHNEPVPNILDPAVNAKAAVDKFQSQGLSAWGTYTSGAYKKFFNGSIPPEAAQGGKGGGGGDSSQQSQGGLGLITWPADILNFFITGNTVLTGLLWIEQPSSWLRIGAFLAGVVLLLFAIRAFIAAGNGENPLSLPSPPPVVPVPL